MKAILISIKPEWCAKILNGEKTIEIRKRFPKDFVGWVYIYCTKDKNLKLYQGFAKPMHTKDITNPLNYHWGVSKKFGGNFNGKVVARFWCDKVEDIFYNPKHNEFMSTLNHSEELYTKSCLKREDFVKYFGTTSGNCGYAIHITKLEIFDEPKELNEFYGYTDKKVERYTGLPKVRVLSSLSRAPQSWQYIEVEE